MTLIKKITDGYVEQIFEDGKCVGQRFVACGDVSWEEGDDYNLIDAPDWANDVYQPFDMIQPTE